MLVKKNEIWMKMKDSEGKRESTNHQCEGGIS